jgi:hypothetical protein
MLYLAGLCFVMALALIGADYAGVRAAHHAGVTGTLFLVLALGFALARQVRQMRRHE